MSYNIQNDTITVDDVEYNIKRERDMGGSGEETLIVTLYSMESDEFEPIEGLAGNLGYEEHMEGLSPRDWSNVGTMAVSYNGYNLGDENIKEIDFVQDCDRCQGMGGRTYTIPVGDDDDDRDVPVTCAKCNGNGWFDMHPVEYLKKERGARVVLPLTVYEHSGITMQVGKVGDYPFDSQGWDTSFVGFIFDTPEGVTQCIGDSANDEEIKNALLSEVTVYASYLEGDVTWWSVQDEETDFQEGCGGYVGEHKHTEEECFQALERAIEARVKEDNERAYWLNREVMTV